MDVYVQLKSLGKRKAILEKTPYSLGEDVDTAEELIRQVVTQEVVRYNSKETNEALVFWLGQEDIGAQKERGKVSFGRRYNEREARLDKALETALTAFDDGLVKIFVDDRELESLASPLVLQEGAVITFIRLTFLSGRLW